MTAIVATRDRPRSLGEAIDAILGQRYPGPIECLVVFDRADPDRALERDGPDRSVRVLANARAPGPAGARNTGIERAEGDLIAHCDDDDRWLADRLARGAEALARHPECEVAVGPIRLVYDDREVERGFGGELIGLSDLVRDRVVSAHTSTFLVRRPAYERIGLVDEEVPDGFGEDYDWLLRAARRGPIAFASGPPLAAIDRTGSMFAAWRGIERGIAYLLAKHPELSRDRRGHARLLGRRALCRAALGERRGALAMAGAALRRYPLERRALAAIPIAAGALSAERLRAIGERWGRTA